MRKLFKKGEVNIPLVLFVLLTVILIRIQLERYFNPKDFKGPWYSVSIPEGWEKKEMEDEVIFMSPDKDYQTDLPEAIFSIYSVKSKGALFLGDLFHQVMEELKKTEGEVLKFGDIELDGQRAKWLLFRYKEPSLIVLTFYIVDDFNRLTKMQYVTKPELFTVYRPTFEAFKGTFKYKQMF